MNEQGVPIGGLKITPAMLTGLIAMVRSSRISGLTAKEVITRMASEGRTAGEIVGELGVEQVSDEAELKGLILKIMESNPGETAQYRAGKAQLLGFFVGEVMKASKGRANPKVAGNIIAEMLKP